MKNFADPFPSKIDMIELITDKLYDQVKFKSSNEDINHLLYLDEYDEDEDEDF